jgi:hypothetical protein
MGGDDELSGVTNSAHWVRKASSHGGQTTIHFFQTENKAINGRTR